jgi:hypothetical protein
VTNERISDTTGNEGMFAELVSTCNYLTGSVLATSTGIKSVNHGQREC